MYVNLLQQGKAEVLAFVTAYYGVTFRLFSTSVDISKGLTTIGFSDLPKSPATLKIGIRLQENYSKTSVN